MCCARCPGGTFRKWGSAVAGALCRTIGREGREALGEHKSEEAGVENGASPGGKRLVLLCLRMASEPKGSGSAVSWRLEAPVWHALGSSPVRYTKGRLD